MTSPTFPPLCERRLQRFVFIFQAVALLLLPAVSRAQVATASINGTIADSSGAAVPVRESSSLSRMAGLRMVMVSSSLK